MTQTRIIKPGRTRFGAVFCKIKFDKRRLSITGVEGPAYSGNATGSCGQITDALGELTDIAPGWNKADIDKLRAIWDRWHLNDMQAGCEHQRASWDTSKPITLQCWERSPRFHQWRRSAESGAMLSNQYPKFAEVSKRVHALTIGLNCPKWESPEAAALLADGWIVPGKTGTKAAGWVDYREHPDGLLSKPCPVCCYAYGSQWLFEPVPDAVIAWLFNLPETDVTPAWV